jgi:hypothetical protein
MRVSFISSTPYMLDLHTYEWKCGRYFTMVLGTLLRLGFWGQFEAWWFNWKTWKTWKSSGIWMVRKKSWNLYCNYVIFYFLNDKLGFYLSSCQNLWAWKNERLAEPLERKRRINRKINLKRWKILDWTFSQSIVECKGSKKKTWKSNEEHSW